MCPTPLKMAIDKRQLVFHNSYYVTCNNKHCSFVIFLPISRRLLSYVNVIHAHTKIDQEHVFIHSTVREQFLLA